jgi:hypothetical protein
MRKRVFSLAVMGLCFFASFGQVSLSVHEPPPGIVQKSQLWNLTLIYSGNTPLDVTIGLSLVDLKDNQPAMTAMTRPISLVKGIRQLKALDVSPVAYNYFSTAFDVSRMGDAFLPIGNYRACFTVSTANKDPEVVLFEDCINLEIQPLAPPQLNLPSDTSRVETSYPQFNWLPPVPLTLFSNLNYDLLIVEVQPGQTPEAAIQGNLPVYSALHLTTPVNNYPASYKSLDTGKVYAWRVIAKNGEAFAAQSDVWTFRIEKPKPAQLAPTKGAYLELRNDNGFSGTAIIPDNILGIKYYSYDKTHDASIKFFDDKGQLVKEMPQTIQYGNNFIALSLDNSFKKETTYFMELADLQGSRYRSSFRIAK